MIPRTLRSGDRRKPDGTTSLNAFSQLSPRQLFGGKHAGSKHLALLARCRCHDCHGVVFPGGGGRCRNSREEVPLVSIPLLGPLLVLHCLSI